MSRYTIANYTNDETAGEGFSNLATGYLSYAEEVLINRAFPDIHDGLKPVQRFILHYLNIEKDKGFKKSMPVSAAILKYHPHGEASVYEAMVRMTDVHGLFLTPLVKAKGNFGASFTRDPAAAPRYTNVTEIPYKEELFSMMNGIQYAKTDSDLEYPVTLPVTFPLVLANESNGMGVGFATKIPSFNVTDIVTLVEEYINKGELTTIIAPDFSSKGYIVNNQAEFDKMMHVGKGRVKIRSRIDIEGRDINIRELPFGVTVEKLLKEIEEAEINNLVYADNMSDHKNGLKFVITCRSAATVDQVLMDLYRRTSMQINYSANMVFIDKGKPVQTGVYGVIERWVAWRKTVIQQEATLTLTTLREKIKKVEAFIRLLADPVLLEKFLYQVTKESSDTAQQLLIKELKIDLQTAKWITDRRVSQFNKGASKYNKQYQDMLSDIAYYEDMFNFPSKLILKDMARIKRNTDICKPRKTEITNKDFIFVDKKSEEALVDESDCFFYIEKGFIKKFAAQPSSVPSNARLFPGKANDVIVSIDEDGSIYRTYGEDLKYTIQGELGTYIPRYAGVGETSFIWHALAKTDDKKLLIYNDGYVGYLDLTPFARENVNQRSRYMQNGINKATDQLLDIVDYDDTQYLAVEDVATRNPKLGIIPIKDIELKARTSRTKVMNARATSKYGLFTQLELEEQVELEDFLVSKDKRKMEVYNGQFPVQLADYEGEEMSYAEAQTAFDSVVL